LYLIKKNIEFVVVFIVNFGVNNILSSK